MFGTNYLKNQRRYSQERASQRLEVIPDCIKAKLHVLHVRKTSSHVIRSLSGESSNLPRCLHLRVDDSCVAKQKLLLLLASVSRARSFGSEVDGQSQAQTPKRVPIAKRIAERNGAPWRPPPTVQEVESTVQRGGRRCSQRRSAACGAASPAASCAGAHGSLRARDFGGRKS